jgi:hypothetical protein
MSSERWFPNQIFWLEIKVSDKRVVQFKRLSMRRVNKREWDAAMFPIDTLVDLGHLNDARISERHRPIPICLMQLEQGRDMLLDAGRDPILNAPFSRSSNSASCALGKAREEIHRLGQHWLAYEQRRVQFLDLFDYSGVVLFRPVEKGDQWSRINNGGTHRDRSLRSAQDWMRGPQY